MSERYRPDELVRFAGDLFRGAGLDGEKAETTAALLVEGDLMGHTTHGLQLAAPYLQELQDGTMRANGAPEILSDRGPTAAWDGLYLPGVWLTAKAVDQSVERAKQYGLAAVAIRRSHHIACLQAYLPRATEQGCMVIVTCSDPSVQSVAPAGGTTAVFTPDPIAIGIPTADDPILIDISASITTNGMAARLHQEGKRFDGQWVQDASGNATDDPGVFLTDPPGTVLPIGGQEYGHKGTGLALTIEALSQGLSGFGRFEAPTNWGAATFVQVYDPDAFAGAGPFAQQTSHVAEMVRASKAAPGRDTVRVPGQRALSRRRTAMAQGLELYPGILDAMRSWAERFDVAIPQPV